MAQLFFKYGAMNSGKSIEILKVAHNYEEQNKPVLLMTSALDTRSGEGTVASRIGIEHNAYPITTETNVLDVVKSMIVKNGTYFCILIDESQFLTREQVLQLCEVVDSLNIPVMSFGLKNDFQNNLFEGSKALLEYADKLEEIKTICWKCHKKATMNLRLLEGKPAYEGEQLQIGGNESYVPVCRRHYFNYK